MSYRYREGLELVSEAISNLKFRDMWRLSFFLEQTVSDSEGEKLDAEFFAHTLSSWAETVNEEYEEGKRNET